MRHVQEEQSFIKIQYFPERTTQVSITVYRVMCDQPHNHHNGQMIHKSIEVATGL